MHKITYTLYTIEATANLINQYPALAALDNWKRHPVKSNILILRDGDKEYIEEIAQYLKSKSIPFTKGEL